MADLSTLFTGTETGYWVDPSDLSTLWQDTAGTTPVTTDGDPVALVLDKSTPNLVTNGSFDTDLTGWGVSGDVTWDAGAARMARVGANAEMQQHGISVPDGTSVTIRWTQTLSGSGTQRTRLRVRNGANSGDLNFTYYNGSGDFEVTVVTASGGFGLWFIVENEGTVAHIDDVVATAGGGATNFTGSTTYRTDGERHWLEGGSLSTGSDFTLKASWHFRTAGQVNDYNGQVFTITGSGTDYIRLSPYVSANRLQSYTRLGSQGIGQVTGDDRSVPFGTDTYIKMRVVPNEQSVQQNGNTPSVYANSWTTETLAGCTASLISDSTGMRLYQALAIDRVLTAPEEAEVDAHFQEKRDGPTQAGSTSGSTANTGTAVGLRAPGGVAGGSVDNNGGAVGEAPVIPPSEGTSVGTVALTGAASGTHGQGGSTSGELSNTGAATGYRISRGAASGSVLVAGTAHGTAVADGRATGSVAITGSATGSTTRIMFTPPVRWVGNEYMGEKPYRFYRHQVSMSVIYRNGHYQEVRVVDDTGLTEGETWFPGGRTHEVDNDTKLLLEADGFAVETV